MSNLSKWSQSWKDAPTDRDDNVPDGTYQVRVDEIALKQTKKTGDDMLSWKFKVVGPQFAGRIIWKNSVIASDDNVRFLKIDLHRCGLDLSDLSELEHRLTELLDLNLEIQVKTKNDNSNVYINKRIDSADGIPF